MKEINITNQEQNQRLDKFLLKFFNEAPKSFIYKMLRKKRIKLNGKKADGSELLQEGDSLTLYLAEETQAGFMSAKTVHEAERHFGIIYEDDTLLVCNKPAGLLTHPEKADDHDTLIDQILYYLYQKEQYDPSAAASFTPAVCNRLDRNTSGLILAGKTLGSVQTLNEAIQKKYVEKYYLALVTGNIKEAGEINSYLSKDQSKNISRISFEGEGVQAESRYRPIIANKDYTLLEIRIITGRSHQIRAHMQAIDHPIAGDRKYGREDVNMRFKEKYALSHQFLHAYRLCFSAPENPLDIKEREFVAPLPKSLQKICEDIFGYNEFTELEL